MLKHVFIKSYVLFCLMMSRPSVSRPRWGVDRRGRGKCRSSHRGRQRGRGRARGRRRDRGKVRIRNPGLGGAKNPGLESAKKNLVDFPHKKSRNTRCNPSMFRWNGRKTKVLGVQHLNSGRKLTTTCMWAYRVQPPGATPSTTGQVCYRIGSSLTCTRLAPMQLKVGRGGGRSAEGVSALGISANGIWAYEAPSRAETPSAEPTYRSGIFPRNVLEFQKMSKNFTAKKKMGTPGFFRLCLGFCRNCSWKCTASWTCLRFFLDRSGLGIS